MLQLAAAGAWGGVSGIQWGRRAAGCLRRLRGERREADIWREKRGVAVIGWTSIDRWKTTGQPWILGWTARICLMNPFGGDPIRTVNLMFLGRMMRCKP